MFHRTITATSFAAVIIAEVIVIVCGTWIAAGLPGLPHISSPPSITIEFVPRKKGPLDSQLQRI